MTDSVLNDVNVDMLHKSPRHPGGSMDTEMAKRPIPETSSRSNDYVYVNSAYTGSLNSVNTNIRTDPPTSVVREQYCVCSKWPVGQRVLAIAVGALVGTVIGLIVSVILLGTENGNKVGFFK
ncbi:uncharacterized protein LOC113234481 [Hyposmocoma kahamanoa]|uniref:uncharacterized protein LOC113234481 n=1 Tax=Hyposmocoma kahamanoa TaxID=1477025 RepID=UPI000E6D607F|nr:uncharacterized protein LOC113234481 [Hyposmocoma kahamanoa]